MILNELVHGLDMSTLRASDPKSALNPRNREKFLDDVKKQDLDVRDAIERQKQLEAKVNEEISLAYMKASKALKPIAEEVSLLMKKYRPGAFLINVLFWEIEDNDEDAKLARNTLKTHKNDLILVLENLILELKNVLERFDEEDWPTTRGWKHYTSVDSKISDAHEQIRKLRSI